MIIKQLKIHNNDNHDNVNKAIEKKIITWAFEDFW